MTAVDSANPSTDVLGVAEARAFHRAIPLCRVRQGIHRSRGSPFRHAGAARRALKPMPEGKLAFIVPVIPLMLPGMTASPMTILTISWRGCPAIRGGGSAAVG